MINEVAHLSVRENQSIQFEKGFHQAKLIVAKRKGFVSLKLYKKFNSDREYLLEINWQSIEDHQLGFRLSPEYQEWKNLLHQYYDPMPKVEYFEEITHQLPIL